MEKKACTKCGAEKLLDDFAPVAAHADGRSSQCRDCRNARHRARRAGIPGEQVLARESQRQLLLAEGKKRCNKCGQAKLITEFHNQQGRSDGRASQCISCVASQERAQQRQLISVEQKRCTGPCGLVRPLADFWLSPGGIGGRYSWCSACCVERAMVKYNNRREQVLEHYGRACACCGSTDRLSIDHVGGNGKAHREQLFGEIGGHSRTTSMYTWIVSNGFPDGFQILCNRCNSSKGRGSYCRLVHETIEPVQIHVT